MEVDAQEHAAQSQSQRPLTRKTQSQGRRPEKCNSTAATDQITRKSLASSHSQSIAATEGTLS
eukprot:8340429-Alexandrium_andersonii.AAC.1